MRFVREKMFLALAAVIVLNLASCSTNSEDDDILEAEDPVEATLDQSSASADSGEVIDPSTAPEAKPATSIAAPSGATADSISAVTSEDTAAPAAAGTYSGSVSRRVMYVKFDGVAMREAADGKSKIVGKLNKGDHLLVNIEGDWSRTDDGKFVKTKSLSEKGIGRGKKDASWSAGSSSEPAASSQPVKTTKAQKSMPPKKLPSKTKASSKTADAKAVSGATPASEGSSDSGAAPAADQEKGQ